MTGGGVRLHPPTHDSEHDGVDVVIPVRVGEHNEQLRHALRSFAKHLPHDRIWIVGYKPTWLRNVHHIPTSQAGSKYINTTAAVRAACEHPDVSDVFLLANDDMFAMVPHRFMPVYHRGLVTGVEAYYHRKRVRSQYLAGMQQTRALLAKLGHPKPLSYEVHVPLPVDKQKMLTTLDVGARVPVLHKRTLYGNLYRIGGTRLRDPKIIGLGDGFGRHADWLSTMSTSFQRGKVGAWIRAQFPQPCRYEQELRQVPVPQVRQAPARRRRRQPRVTVRG